MSHYSTHGLLTKRERQILELLSEGRTNKGIGQILGISNDTVKQHVRHIFNKLDITSRVEAAVIFSMEKHFTNAYAVPTECPPQRTLNLL